jgi:hypothetical protein
LTTPSTARELVDRICGAHRREIPLLVLHDFDDSGFTILGTIARGSKRYWFKNHVNVIDLGLRMADIDGLESEDYSCRADASTLKRHGATPDEIAFLTGGQRVELNAMTSEDFIEFVERKLQEHCIKKVNPDKDVLNDAYCAFARSETVRGAVEKAIDGSNVAVAPWHSRMPPVAAIEAPADLGRLVAEHLDAHPPWEAAAVPSGSASDGSASPIAWHKPVIVEIWNATDGEPYPYLEAAE